MVSDLSKVHELLSDLFEWPKSEKDWDQYRLTEDQIAFFHTNGYLPNIKLLDHWQVAQLNKELESLTNPNQPGMELFYDFASNESSNPETVLFHSLGHWRIKEGFHDILWNPAFVMAASQLLGDNSVRFWHDQLFCKPAKHGGVVAWHQDYSYWTRSVPMQHLTCWVGLDDVDIDNGCLYYVPKSHEWGLLDKPELAGDMEGLMEYLTEDQKKEFKPVPIEMERGYGSFHHPLMVHGSYENKSERSRRAFVLNVFADGTKSNTEKELLKGVPIFAPGEKLDGQFFPLLFDRSQIG
ncbi:phytanoyl-CoA dioxygenase family protein [Cyclobacterium amurskyense]|jgi:ectoine hydroxylase-related dioxygenase (phytanoyl-CoA dioxygenase family)|uniref:Phytanoyl-CoA dioxygenase n=1 Tax=Cyclobacterium amurskyense TaxID=320787 RepID=A0A0H4PGP7_9BACT|nr:phytanoyl-CoA dioxygenase family protein [Cyclobacterium amurskyense]AKP53364.1 Phytanoyl-CoA dioxygenase [Cyclobacterium amurskyense]|tara:strand:- start:2341 stop:3225 length:885 start_codon:yes stop_codon:yes gene_type:complete